MTDRAARNGKSMCIRIWLEVGHSCEPRPLSSLGRSLALDWSVWVRGASGHDISPFVEKIVFYLHPASAFVYPKRVIQEPPYEISESGYTSIDIPIHVYIKNSSSPKKIKLNYTLRLEDHDYHSSDSNCVYYDFANPSEDLKRCLLIGGGEVIANSGVFNARHSKLLVVIKDNSKHAHRKTKHIQDTYKFIKPVVWKKPKSSSKNNRITSICKDAEAEIDFKKILSNVAMTDSEITAVSEVYWSHYNYEKSEKPIILPPMSDPIYKIPELPSSLKSFFSAKDSDYAIK